MFFNLRRILLGFEIIEPTDLISPNACQNKCSIFTFPFDLTFFQIKGLDNSLKEQFDGFFAIVIQVIFPRPILFREVDWSQDETTCFFVFRNKIFFAESCITKHHISYLKSSFSQFFQSNFSFVVGVLTPDRKKWNRHRKDQCLQEDSIALDPSTIV